MFSTTSFQQINSSPLNNSNSKSLWTIPKSKRFPQMKPLCDKIYEKESSIRKKGLSIGKQKRADFTKTLTNSPGVGSYSFQASGFMSNLNKKRGYSIPNGRTDKVNSYIPQQQLKFPTATKYCPKDQYGIGIQHSMRKRTKIHDKLMTLDPQNDNPGPGYYNNPQMTAPNGKYLLSKHNSFGNTIFTPKKLQRFSPEKNFVPGPGSYQQINNLSNEGKYTVSKSFGTGKRVFDRQKRENQQLTIEVNKNRNPGPGSYRLPSQFGYYEAPISEIRKNMSKTKRSMIKHTIQ